MTPPGAAAPAPERTESAAVRAVDVGAAPVADSPRLLRPQSYECAGCAGRFPARARPTPYCSAQCAAEAKAVRYARRQRQEFGDVLPDSVRAKLHRMVVHALTECGWDRWSGASEPDPVEPPAVPPLAAYLDPVIPDRDVFGRRAHQLKVRALAPRALRPCDAAVWDSIWRTWVNAHAR